MTWTLWEHRSCFSTLFFPFSSPCSFSLCVCVREREREKVCACVFLSFVLLLLFECCNFSGGGPILHPLVGDN